MVKNVDDILREVLDRMTAVASENPGVELETIEEAVSLQKLTKLLLNEPDRIGGTRLAFLCEQASMTREEQGILFSNLLCL